MAAAIVRSLAASALQLSRDRPASHKGALYRIAATQPDAHDSLRAVPTPPCYDPELAAVLRAACMVLAPGAAVPRGAVAYAVLAGPTLAAWYHLGAQVPWKRHVHLAVPVARAPDDWTAERLARDVTRHLRLAGMDIAEVTLRPSGPGQCTAEWLIRAGAGGGKKEAGKAARKGPGPAAAAALVFPPRPDRPDIRLIAHVELSPLPPERLPGLRKLARVAIDGANTAAFVPGGRAEVAAAVRAWAEAEARAAQGAAGKPASAIRKAASDATARLDMPRGWAWAPDEGAFVRPAFPASALQWPPNLTSLKAAVALAVVLGVVYMLAMVALPEWGARIQLNRAIRSARTRQLSAIASPAT